LIPLAIAIAPLALLAAINASFRVAPFTAVIVVVGSSVTHAGPVDSALYRVLEVALGGVTGLAVSLLAFPTRAHILAIEGTASTLDLMAEVLPELLFGFTQTLDEKAALRRQDRIDQAKAVRHGTLISREDMDPIRLDFRAGRLPLQRRRPDRRGRASETLGNVEADRIHGRIAGKFDLAVK
jgi:uncharacterized membrane protein YccC